MHDPLPQQLKEPPRRGFRRHRAAPVEYQQSFVSRDD
jgi:hypothetical protein